MAKVILPKHLTDLEARELVWGPPDVILDESNFEPFQTWMADAIRKLPGVLLAAEMGLGKTAATLKAISDLLDDGTVTKVLIVAPLYVAEETWPEEIAKWAFARGLTYRIVTGDAAQRKASLAYGPCDVTIINRENLLWLLKTLGTKRWHFDMIVYDEASRLKRGKLRSDGTQRQDGTMSTPRLTELGIINHVRLKTKRFVALSGTPAPNGLIDLFGPMFAVDGGQRLGTSYNAFKQRYFLEDKYTKEITAQLGAEEAILGAIKDRFFALREQDYVKLPPLVPVDHYVKFPDKLMARYRQFERDSVMELVNAAGEEALIEAVNGGVLTGKLLQFANGSMYTTEQEAIPMHTLKMDVLDSIMEEAAGQPVLCAYSFKFDAEAILKRFGKRARLFGSSKSDKRDWDAGRIPLMVMHPASAGHGLNFQFSSNIAVWYGLTWSHELYWQFIKRLHRRGQKHDKVFLHRIIARGTMDEKVLPVLVDKKATEDRIKRAVLAQIDKDVGYGGRLRNAA